MTPVAEAVLQQGGKTWRWRRDSSRLEPGLDLNQPGAGRVRPKPGQGDRRCQERHICCWCGLLISHHASSKVSTGAPIMMMACDRRWLAVDDAVAVAAVKLNADVPCSAPGRMKRRCLPKKIWPLAKLRGVKSVIFRRP